MITAAENFKEQAQGVNVKNFFFVTERSTK